MTIVSRRVLHDPLYEARVKGTISWGFQAYEIGSESIFIDFRYLGISETLRKVNNGEVKFINNIR